eukprot:m51a1_g7454 hypothetical protein (602) ;mRNA; r:119282-121360
MRPVLLLALLVACSFACDDLCLWNAWKAQYTRSYASPEIEEYRFGVFKSNVAEYARRNAEPGQTAVYGPDRFSDLTGDEFASEFLLPDGVPHSQRPVRSAAAPEAPLRRSSVPASFTTPYTTPARSQGTCGACWAFASVAVLEAAYMRTHSGSAVSLSPQNMIDCARYTREAAGWDGCRGYNTADFLAELVEDGRNGGGVALESQYPYEMRKQRCQKSLASPGALVVESSFIEAVDETEGSALYQRLMDTGPVAVAINSGNMRGYRSGIVQHDGGCLRTASGQYAADHAVTLVGWGEQDGHKYWLAKNSWGPRWGEPLDYRSGGEGQGYFRLERGVSACHIADHGAAGAVVKPPQCVPASRAAACGARQCGVASNGCGATIECGQCAGAQVCQADGSCADQSDWVEYYPAGASGDFAFGSTPAGAVVTTSQASDDSEKRATWRNSWRYTSDQWTSLSAQVATSGTGIVGLGLRGGQQSNDANGVSWKLSVLSYDGGPTAMAYLLKCFFFDYDSCEAVGQFQLAMNTLHNFTIVFEQQADSSTTLVMRPWLDGVPMTGPSEHTVSLFSYPAPGRAFVVASGKGKTFLFPVLRTRYEVHASMR